jgi:hypothetical protein
MYILICHTAGTDTTWEGMSVSLRTLMRERVSH